MLPYTIKKNAHENIKKLPSKVAYFMAKSEIFSTANLPKTSPNLKFCSIKIAHHATLCAVHPQKRGKKYKPLVIMAQMFSLQRT